MKRKNLLCILLMFTMTLSVALGGCAGDKKGSKSTTDNNASTKQTEGGKMVVGIPQDLEDSLDPHIAVAAGTEEILFNIFEGLVKPDKDGNLVDAVASKHQISQDGKVYTFTLREGVKFHNGKDVTAEDVKYSIDRCADTSNGEPLVSAFSNIESVNILDDQRVEITLKEADTEFLAYMTEAITPKDYTDQATHPVGTGPFAFVSRLPQENIIVKKFDGYWGEKAHLKEVEFRVVADTDMIVTNLKGGSIDMFQRLTSSQAAELSKGFRIQEGTMNLVQALYLNNASEPFQNEKVRQALCYAIDPQEIMDMIADGKGTEIGSSMFPAFGKYYDESLKDVYQPDVEKAKKLLKEAGYPDGFAMTITVPSNYQPHLDTAQVIVEELKKINVDATIQPVEWNSWLSDVYTGRKFQSTVVGVDASAMTARALLERFTSTSGKNFINYHNEKYDQLFQEAVKTTDEKKQVTLYKEMEKLLAKDAANVYIQDMANLVALNDKFDGYTFYPAYILDMSKIYQVEK
ncbi:MAG: ABC transporter substrate-binding protein [Lachnospiraceae bacterium]